MQLIDLLLELFKFDSDLPVYCSTSRKRLHKSGEIEIKVKFDINDKPEAVVFITAKNKT